MTIRIAAIGVSHWHALNDAAYLRHLRQGDETLPGAGVTAPDVTALRDAIDQAYVRAKSGR